MHSTLLHNSDLKLNNRYAVISAAGALITVIKENPHELKDRLHFEAFKWEEHYRSDKIFHCTYLHFSTIFLVQAVYNLFLAHTWQLLQWISIQAMANLVSKDFNRYLAKMHSDVCMWWLLLVWKLLVSVKFMLSTWNAPILCALKASIARVSWCTVGHWPHFHRSCFRSAVQPHKEMYWLLSFTGLLEKTVDSVNVKHCVGSVLHLLLRKTGRQQRYHQRVLELLAGGSFTGEASRNLCLLVAASTEEGRIHVVILRQLEDLKER